MTREEAYYNSELILLDYCIWQNLDDQAKETLIEGVQIGIDQIYDAHEVELKAKDERIEAQSSVIIACQNAILQKDECITELEAKLKNMCAECECAKFADNAIKPSEMWKLHLTLKDNK